MAVLPTASSCSSASSATPGEVFLELPAGKLDPDETLLACAQRELLEETRLPRAGHWQHLARDASVHRFPPTKRIEIFFFARDLHFEARSSTRARFLEIVSMSYEAEAAVLDGSITDIKPLQPVSGTPAARGAGIPKPMTPFQRPSPVPAQAGTQYGVFYERRTQRRSGRALE